MASYIADLGGYDCDFVEAPPDELLCLICTVVAREPMQMDCCGKVYCKACLTELKKRSSKCPNCRERGNGFKDKKSEREIQALRVRCGNLGCAWVGELGSLDKHQDTCDQALLACPNECKNGTKSVQVLRKNLATHLEVKCPNRSYWCPHCAVEGKHRDITTSHLETCTELEVPCPNEGCYDRLPRADIPEHRKTCPFEEVNCKYSTIGCEETPLREDLEDHESNDQLHLHIAMETILNREADLAKLKTEIIHIRTTASDYFTFKMARFSQYKAFGEDFFSPPFYTHHGGFKMCIAVNANGVDEGADTHIAVFAYLMRGENDDNLTWPFTGGVTVQLLNQLADKQHYRQVIPYPEDEDGDHNRRVVDAEWVPEGWGCPMFISHADLSYKSITRQFLKDDCLYFRVSVKPSPKTKPWLTCTT